MNLLKQEVRWLARGDPTTGYKRPIGCYSEWGEHPYFSTYEDALAYKHPMAHGVGLVTGNGCAVVDLDNVLMEGHQEGYDFALSLVNRANSWTEQSVSGNGLHIYGYYTGADDTTHSTRPAFKKEHGFGCEVFCGQHFVAYTGIHLKWTPDCLRNIDGVIEECIGFIASTEKDKQAPKYQAKAKPQSNARKVTITNNNDVEFVSIGEVLSVSPGYNICPNCGMGDHQKSHNFNYDSHSEQWCCFQDGHSGGGIQMAIAVKAGILDCKDAQPGALRGLKYIEMLEYAKAHGYIKEKRRRKVTLL